MAPDMAGSYPSWLVLMTLSLRVQHCLRLEVQLYTEKEGVESQNVLESVLKT